MTGTSPSVEDLLGELDLVAQERTARDSPISTDVAPASATGAALDPIPKTDAQAARQARLAAESLDRECEAVAGEVVLKALKKVNAHLDLDEVDAHDAAELAKLGVRVKEARDRVRLAEGTGDNIPNITIMIGSDFTHTINVEPTTRDAPQALPEVEDVTPRASTEPAAGDTTGTPSAQAGEIVQLLSLRVEPLTGKADNDEC